MDKIHLLTGERQLGRYMGVILRRRDGHWIPAVQHLDTIVTNYRLLLRPLLKRYDPASIPGSYLSDVVQEQLGRHECLLITLRTGQMLTLMVSTGRLADLYDDIQAMRARPPHFGFDNRITRDDIQRLVRYFDHDA